MNRDDLEHVWKLRSQFAREAEARHAAWRRKRCATPPEKLQANRERAEERREAACAARHAEHQAMIAEMRRVRLEASQAAWEKAERRRNAARIRRESLLMWEGKP
jgi:hypothetical protein